MYCPMCGSRNNETDKFCGRCGHSLHVEAVPVFEPLPLEAPPPPLEAFTFSTPESMNFEYAGFWRRFMAFLFDCLVLLGFTTALSLFFREIRPFVFIPDTFVFFSSQNAGSPTGFMMSLIPAWLYYAIQESTKMQATLGKMIAGIQIADLKGTRISFSRATLRHFGKILSALIFFIGFLMIGFTRKKQGLHDKIAGCLVIKRK